MSDEFNINLGSTTAYKINVHPLVPLSILEFFYRKKGQKVTGTLLGTISPTSIDITNVFAVPITNDQDDYVQEQNNILTIDTNYHKVMMDMKQKVYPNEVLIGAFITESDNTDKDVAILTQYFSAKEFGFIASQNLSSPVILTIDPMLQNGSFDLKAFCYDKSLDLAKNILGIVPFKQEKINVEFNNEKLYQVSPFILEHKENFEFDLLKLENFKEMIKELVGNLQDIQTHVQQIINKKSTPNEQLGKNLKKLLTFAPTFSKTEYSSMIEKYNQDTQLILFLSNLARTHNVVSEKLNSIH